MGDRDGGLAGRGRALRTPLVLLVALVLGGLLVAVPRPASAVTPVASDPQDRQELADQPGAVTLAFSRNVDAGVAKVVVIGPDGKNVTDGPLIVEGTNVTSRLRTGLPKGTYTVHFRVDGRSGEPEGGAYQFAYGSGQFGDLPDRSWTGSDQEPAVLRGSNPNTSEEPDPPSTALQTPGIEVTSQGASTDPEPPATAPASTVEPPPGPTSVAGSAPATSVGPASSSPAAGSGGGGGPWLVGGILLLVAVVFGALGVYRSRTKGSAGHE